MNFASELLRYGDHGPSCPRREYFGDCICGWDAVRRAALTAALDDAQRMARASAETEGLRSLRTAKPGPKDAPA